MHESFDEFDYFPFHHGRTVVATDEQNIMFDLNR